MSSEELLLVLVLNVLYHEEPSNVIDDVVLIKGVVVDCLLVLAIVTD